VAWRIGGKVVVVLVASSVFGATAYGYTTLTSLETGLIRSDVIGGGHETPPGEQPADGAVDILLVGRDAREDNQGRPLAPEVLRELRAGANGDDLTDTLIVLRIPNGQQQVKAFSIPRDSYVDLPGKLGKNKINAAFGLTKFTVAGKLRKDGVTDKARITSESVTAARRATRQVVEDVSGVTIDHYAEVNLLSFYEISKAVGGVEVCLNRATKDKDSGADFPAGKQIIAGADALAFVRQRHDLPDSDFDRVRRQQTFLASLAKTVLSGGTLANPAKLSDLIDAVKKSVVLDDGWNILDFIQQMKGLSGGAIEFATVPVGNKDYRYDPKNPRLTAVQVDPAQIKSFARELIGAAAPPVPPTRGPTVDVYNTSTKAGLAGRVVAELTKNGFTEGTVDQQASRKTSLVRFGAAMATKGAEVATLLGGLTTQVSADVPAGHIEVLLGQVYSGPGANASGGGSPSGQGLAVADPITAGGGNCIN
jgi:LCP family protein required for cell wall assembly